MKLAYDDNLGLPQDFSRHFGFEPVAFHDVGAQIAAFEGGQVQAMFAPCGALPYVRGAYGVIAQATFGADRRRDMESRYVVPVGSTSDATIFTNGWNACVNVYCTTSYWAPMLARMDVLPQGTAVKFRTSAGFADMLHSVCDGRADASMVWDAVLQQHPDDAAQTRELFGRGALPTPAIFSNATLDERERDRLARELASYSAGPPWFFSGFCAPDLEAIRHFADDARAALRHYTLRVA